MSRDGLPDIKDYGVIGDSRASALISRAGSIDWCCLPKFDSPSFFAAILDPERGGKFSIQPVESFHSLQSYLPNTNILETRFRTRMGEIALKDCFITATEKKKREELFPDHEILRIIEGISGDVQVRLRLLPRAEYGKHGLRLKRLGNWGIGCSYGRKVLVLQMSSVQDGAGVLSQHEDGDELVHDFRLKAGDRVVVSLTYADEAPAVIPSLKTAGDRFERTRHFWNDWLRTCDFQGFYQDEVRRSALTLKLLTFAPSGAIIAAPTSSLPEAIGYARNWDYRFCWLRDASFTIRALIDLRFIDEAKAYMSWLLHSTRLTFPRLQVVYTVYGEARIPERSLSWLSGYKNSQPVRVGNSACDQVQLDIYGEVIDGLFRLLPHLSHIDGETQKLILGMAETVCKEWDRPDNGIWEVRSAQFHHTHSKVMAWVALDRVIKMSSRFSRRVPLQKFQSTLNEIRAVIETRGYNERLQAYVQSFGDDRIDASLLVMPIVGYCDALSPRMRSTVAAIQAELGRNGFVYRYPPNTDGMKGREGAFVISGFWLVEVLLLQGRYVEARKQFEQILARANSTNLWSEEIDPETGEFLGNYPQGFSHIGLINAAVALSKYDQKKEQAA
jgi:GH15 family glucan-1,4-alpha-glucosidase